MKAIGNESKLPLGRPSSKLNYPPKVLIPSSEKMKMKRNIRIVIYPKDL